tara:strand:+ start:4038 stop:4319 length:282 start_codon:yes stop_codon:yes gene_type:complete
VNPSGYFAEPFIAIEEALIRLVPAKTGMLLQMTMLIAKKSEMICRDIFIVELLTEVRHELIGGKPLLLNQKYSYIFYRRIFYLKTKIIKSMLV